MLQDLLFFKHINLADDQGNTALLFATRLSDPHLAGLLLQCGALIAPFKDRPTALKSALAWGNTRVAEYIWTAAKERSHSCKEAGKLLDHLKVCACSSCNVNWPVLAVLHHSACLLQSMIPSSRDIHSHLLTIICVYQD